ncbi:MAG: hypothetical protein HPY71_10570 [Firmicutes bacterium]|nr:hypothetical protein [Bacillota bacterium]
MRKDSTLFSTRSPARSTRSVRSITSGRFPWSSGILGALPRWLLLVLLFPLIVSVLSGCGIGFSGTPGAYTPGSPESSPPGSGGTDGSSGSSKSTGSIEGYVYAGRTSRSMTVSRLAVAPEGHDPVSGARVLVEGTSVSAGTDSSGYFRIDNVAPGIWTLIISHPDYRDPVKTQVRVEAGHVTPIGPVQLGIGYYLFIGIDDYMDPRVNDLTGCVADATAMRDALMTPGSFVGQGGLLTNSAASKAGIRQAIEGIGQRMNREDFFVLYYSGHGARALDGSKEVICPYDSSPLSWGSDITDGELADWLRGLPSQKITVILDSCYSGAFINGNVTRAARSGVPAAAGAPAATRVKGVRGAVLDAGATGKMGKAALMGGVLAMKALRNSGYTVLTASSQDELSYEVNGHGVFTSALVKALGTDRRRADTSQDGIITARELFDYAASETKRATMGWNSANPGGPAQTPQLELWPGNNPPVLRYR